MLPEVRMARIIDAIGLHQARKLSCVAAAELLGMSERHFRRLRDAYEAHGAEGIVDRRRGRASGRRAGVDEIERGSLRQPGVLRAVLEHQHPRQGPARPLLAVGRALGRLRRQAAPL